MNTPLIISSVIVLKSVPKGSVTAASVPERVTSLPKIVCLSLRATVGALTSFATIRASL